MNRGYLAFGILLIAAVGIGWAISSQENPENITSTNGNNTPPGNTSDGKPIYYYFYSDTCPSCVKMEGETLSNATVIESLGANFTFIKVNTGKERQLSQKYGIIYVPTNVFTFPGGQEIGRAVGAVDPENFLNMLDQVLEFYAQNA